MSDSGKSTIGALLARVLTVPFLGADGLHPQANIVKMASGVPLTDADRCPWLALVGQALADTGAAGTGLVIACSALKRVYRDAIVAAAPNVRFVHLAGTLDVLDNWHERRSEHFMPPVLLRSQLATLEELHDDEPGLSVGIDWLVSNVVTESKARVDAPKLPASVHIGVGQVGLPVVRVNGLVGAAAVYLQDAHMTSWNPEGQPSVLWMSTLSGYAPGRPIRGGMPICLPWFGLNETDATAPPHGFARLAEWRLVQTSEAGDDIVLVFHLSDSKQSRRSVWPHRFEALCTVTVDAELAVALRVHNLDDVSVMFAAETDRIYIGTSAEARISDGTVRVLSIATEGSQSSVVWNPRSAKAAVMPDFGADEWTGVLCVETANCRTTRSCWHRGIPTP
ncbi:gluconokinase, GntK/IdnK-type [Cryobacterium sp. Y11]|uniref:gluconokinase, GntK/IdnK-type n=1 Tax=Cryobacterium sp. Y11 TaxID=2045016 RepID=UPI001E346BF3|nr:gluconokinase, GntK/IdnK-type [Cryobacterium sp. Y11]